MYPNQVVWQPYEAELGHLHGFCVAGRDMWTARVPFCLTSYYVAMHKQILMRYVVDSPEHKLIITMLKEVDRLHRLAAHLPLEDANTTNPELPEQNARPSTSSTPTSHSHGQCATPHQRQNQPPPPPHASPPQRSLDTRLAPRSLTKEMRYSLAHVPNIIQDNISVKCHRVKTPSAYKWCSIQHVNNLFASCWRRWNSGLGAGKFGRA
ncbi:hypothetical protein CMV_009911 [Castanea mollissima]|uniref:Uncharacterized protein n=1 Tax=Castanea mollissima TaxID=60419 RepID=A0A8J4VY88_9ROSI|nr:hypothetical protein CMV_009911 [Castanea mollissima]